MPIRAALTPAPAARGGGRTRTMPGDPSRPGAGVQEAAPQQGRPHLTDSVARDAPHALPTPRAGRTLVLWLRTTALR
ncbi:hypothetical protein [Streptomyces sp. NRRL WC-3618]|uniref:hypothetical protein n=1 Tax=Streptomyces sp. NRRL WC-3618 TaxID=1519490 RepID=UPI00131ABEE0|nr:hypothetical protein [Streptomyces sp. NRRL WC-3618]